MIELIPYSFTWKIYQFYRELGGDPELPQIDTFWRFLRKLVIWMPFRLIFSPKPRIPVIFWLILIVLAYFEPVSGAKLSLFLGIILIYSATTDCLKTVNFRVKSASPTELNGKVLIKLR